MIIHRSLFNQKGFLALFKYKKATYIALRLYALLIFQIIHDNFFTRFIPEDLVLTLPSYCALFTSFSSF